MYPRTMNLSKNKGKHQFHLVDNSQLPLVTSTAAMLLVMSIVFDFHLPDLFHGFNNSVSDAFCYSQSAVFLGWNLMPLKMTKATQTTSYKIEKRNFSSQQKIGEIISIKDGIAKIVISTQLQPAETVTFFNEDEKIYGIAVNIDSPFAFIEILGNPGSINQKTTVKRGWHFQGSLTGAIVVNCVLDKESLFKPKMLDLQPKTKDI